MGKRRFPNGMDLVVLATMRGTAKHELDMQELRAAFCAKAGFDIPETAMWSVVSGLAKQKLVHRRVQGKVDGKAQSVFQLTEDGRERVDWTVETLNKLYANS